MTAHTGAGCTRLLRIERAATLWGMRPLAVLACLAAAMVGWLSVRMWAGDVDAVWRVSCVLGAWAPLGAAAVLRYVLAEGHRENNPAAAWVVRALGMHCVLLWLLGINDYLRGAPGTAPQWNADQGMPLVLLGFAPVLAASFVLLRWASGLPPRLARALTPRPGVPTPAASVPLPYRGPHAPAEAPPAAPTWPRRLAFGAVTLGVLAAFSGVGVALLGALPPNTDPLPALVRWPALSALGATVWLAMLEALVRLRGARG